MKQFYPCLGQFVPGFRINKNATRIAGFLILTLLMNISVFGVDKYSVASGNWSAATTWALSPGGTPGAPAPLAGDNVFIEGGFIVTINAIGAVASNVSIANGSTLTSGSFTLTVSGNFTNNGNFNAGGGTLTVAGNIDNITTGVFNANTGIVNVAGNWNNTGTFNANTGIINFTKTSLTQTLNAGTSAFYNLTHNAAGTLQLISSDLSVSNNLLNSSGNFDPNGRNITNNVSFSVTGGSFSGGSGNLSVATLSLSGGTLVAPSGNFTVSGNWSKTGTSTFTPGTNTVKFNRATTSQMINTSGLTSPFYNVLHSGSGILQIVTSEMQTNGTFVNEVGAGDFDANGRIHTVAGLTTINGGSYLAKGNTQNLNGGLTINAGTFTGSTGTINTTNLVLNVGGTLTAPNATFSIKGNWQNNGGVFNQGTYTTTFNGSLAQTIGGTAPTTFNSLTVTNTPATLTLASNTNVNGLLTVSAIANFNLSSYNLTIAGITTPTLTGTFNTATSTVFYSNTGSIAIAPANYYNLDLAGGARTNAGSIGIANILTPGIVSTIGGTVSFNGAGNQNIPALTYTNLQTATSGTKSLVGNTNVTAVLTVNTGSTIDLGSNTLTLNSNGTPLVVNGSFNASTSTVHYSSTSGTTNITGVNYYNLTSANGTRAFLGSSNIGIANNFVPGATSYTLNSSTVTFNGTTGLQSFTPAFTFNNLSVNNPDGLNINGNVTVNTGLIFNAGRINTGANFLILGNAATVTGAAAGQYVNGNLRKGIAASTVTKNFEVGDNNYYTPVLLAFTGTTNGTGNTTLSTTGSDHPQVNNSEINPSLNANRNWTITNSGVAGFTTYNATFNFNSADVDGGANPSSFIVNRFTPSTWTIPTSSVLNTTSIQATGLGLAEFGDFQVGEPAVAITACGFNANTNSGINVIRCITDLTSVNGSDSLVSNSFAAGQYFTLDVVKGMIYNIYTAGASPASPLTITVYDEAFPANAPIAFSESNAGNNYGAANNILVSFTAPVSGRLRVLINKRRDCASTLPSNFIVRARVVGGSNTEDNPLTAGTDSWVAHMYDGTNLAVPFNGSFTNYLGYYTQSETFDDEFGTNGNNDINCFAGIYSASSIRAAIKISNFSTRYRMNSTRSGLYTVSIGSDDGSRLAIDGKLVYSDWIAQGYAPTNNILFSLTGTSNLVLDFFEAGSDDRMSFLNLNKLLDNQLSSSLTQTICQGSAASAISGDTILLPLPGNITKVAGTGYQWSYSTTPGGPRTNLPSATAATFTPTTITTPFNVAGTYYLYRTVSLRSTNNILPNPDTAVHVSNAAVITITASAPLHSVTAFSSTFCYGSGTNILLSSSDIGISYQLRDDANNTNIGTAVAGTGTTISLPTGPIYASSTFNVLAINTVNLCTIEMTGTPTVSTTPDGGKSVSADFGLVCVGNSATVTVANADLGVRYLLRNDFDNSPVGDTLSGVGDDLDFEIPVGYLVDPLTTFHVWALDVAAGCAGKLLDTVKIATQSLSSPVFDIDQDFCSLDSGKVLLTPTNTGYSSYIWSTDSTTTSIIIQQSGIFTLTVTDINGCRTTKSVNVGEELLINGDFSLGKDVGYTTGYVWAPLNPQNSPQYTINNNARNTHTNFWGKDHTTKTGNFMIINGEGPPRSIWQTKVKVEANTRYYFSAWAMSLNNVGPFAKMVFNIEGVNVGDTAYLPAGVENNSNYGWRRFYGQWESGPRDASNDSVIIKMVNLVTGNNGNDFGLDDISFSKLSPVKFFGASIGNGGNSMCVGASLSLTADLTGGQNPITYQWEGPDDFTSTAANAFIPAGTAVPGWYYLTATEGRNCQSKDSVLIIMADPKASGVTQGAYKCLATGISIYVSGMVPNSRNNTISYTVSTIAGTKIATGVDVDSLGVGAFYIPTSAITTAWDGKMLTVTSISNGSCSRAPSTTVSTIVYVKPNNNIWVGGAAGNWVDPWNWCPGLPATGTSVTIPTGTTIYINNNDSARVNNILLQGNAVVKINNGGRLMFYGNFDALNTGKIDATEGLLETKRDNGNQNLPANFFVNRSISTLLIFNTNTNGKTTITNDSLRILSALLFGNNVADLETNNYLVLASSDTATARMGIIPGNTTQNVITGDFIVERYLMNARKWRMLSAPTIRVGQTVRNSWQESGANGHTIPGYGFLAADPRHTAGNTYGFDIRGNNSSVKKFNPVTEAWDAVANTDALSINAEQGYLVFVAGDRRISFPGSNATRLRTVGTLNRGTLASIPVAANKFTIIGNPYASRIDLKNINISAGIDNAVYVWDPSIGGSYGLGAFNTLFKSGGDYLNTVASPIYGSQFTINNFIESGAAFIVKGNTGGNIVFEENDKAIESQLANFVAEDRKWLVANLKLPAQGTAAAVQLDAAIAEFDDTYTNETDDNDVKKIGNTGETVSWKSNGRDVVVDRRFTPAYNDTLYLKIGQMTVRNYQWEMKLENMDYPGKQAFLLDKYKHTSTELNMSGTTMVNFNIENIPASYASDRFKIVFKQLLVLPVTITSVSASRNNDKTVAVQWKVDNELNLQGYQVDRSSDGRNFTTIKTTLPEHNAGGRVVYHTIDDDGQSGDLFYRIKANSISGQVQYSAIVKVPGIKASAAISVYPNPVMGKQMQVRFSAVESGNYQLVLVNAAGQIVYKGTQVVNNGSSAKSIQLSNDIAAGRYQLTITAPGGIKYNQSIIIE